MRRKSRIRVVVIEDDELVRSTLTSRINDDPRLVCKRSYSSAEAFFNAREFTNVDVFLIDLILPGMSGIQTISRLRRKNVKGQMLVLTNFDDDELVCNAVMAGARGYLLKTTPVHSLMDSLVDIHIGGAPMNSTIARIIVDYLATLPRARSLELLTSREYDVLQRLAGRKLYKEIAIELEMSVDTVRSHVKSIYQKLNIHKRVQAERMFRNL